MLSVSSGTYIRIKPVFIQTLGPSIPSNYFKTFLKTDRRPKICVVIVIAVRSLYKNIFMGLPARCRYNLIFSRQVIDHYSSFLFPFFLLIESSIFEPISASTFPREMMIHQYWAILPFTEDVKFYFCKFVGRGFSFSHKRLLSLRTHIERLKID